MLQTAQSHSYLSMDLVQMQTVTSVQQPCSNPSKYSDMLGKASKQKYSCLQLFCKLLKDPAKYGGAFARRKPGIRIPSAPLKNMQICR
jgi:hypothetical protein